MKFEEWTLGYADSAKEYLLQPIIFEKAFYDPEDNLSKILNSWKYIVSGRKGVGKSAYNAKLRYIADHEEKIWAKNLLLNDFEYSTFAKASCEGDTNGTKKYYDAWNFLILFQIYKYLYEVIGITEIPEFTKIVDLLSRMGFPIESSFKNVVANVSRLKLGANVGVFDAEYEVEFGHKPISFTERMSSVVDKMLNVLQDVYINKKLYLLIDGVDDILRIKKNQIEILSSLIRSIDTLNSIFIQDSINIKLVLFIRDDILNLINDPDMNKIKRDARISISWNDNTDGLKEIVELRLAINSDINQNQWEVIFPSKFKDKPTWEEILTYTLYKPRDVLQFLTVCQDTYPQKSKLTYAEVNNALKIYSRDYFIEEMKNELSGYISDVIISVLPAVFQRIGSKAITYAELRTALIAQLPNAKIEDADLKQLLLVLFESGYVGQLVKGNRNRESVVFKYRNVSAIIDYSQRFLIHKGIQRGLGVIL